MNLFDRVLMAFGVVCIALAVSLGVRGIQSEGKISAARTQPALELERCQAPTQNLKSFGNEIKQLIIRHNTPTLSGGLPDESAASEARGKLDYAERCWHGFTFEGAGITEDDLKTVGYLPRGRRH